MGHKIKNLWNIKHTVTGYPLSLFLHVEPTTAKYTALNIYKVWECKFSQLTESKIIYHNSRDAKPVPHQVVLRTQTKMSKVRQITMHSTKVTTSSIPTLWLAFVLQIHRDKRKKILQRHRKMKDDRKWHAQATINSTETPTIASDNTQEQTLIKIKQEFLTIFETLLSKQAEQMSTRIHIPVTNATLIPKKKTSCYDRLVVANILSMLLSTAGVPESAHRRTSEAGFFGTAELLYL